MCVLLPEKENLLSILVGWHFVYQFIIEGSIYTLWQGRSDGKVYNENRFLFCRPKSFAVKCILAKLINPKIPGSILMTNYLMLLKCGLVSRVVRVLNLGKIVRVFV